MRAGILSSTVVLLSCTLSACATSVTAPQPHYLPQIPLPATHGASARIKHIVIVIQENRSFDNLFAGFPGANAPLFGYTNTGVKVPLQPASFVDGTACDIDHYFKNGVTDYDNGKMDGFNLNTTAPGCTLAHLPLSHLNRSEVKPYWTMAKRYVLADHMFPTEIGPSFTAHLTLIAGTADLSPTRSEADVPTDSEPWGCDAPSGTATYTVDATRVVNDNGPAPCFSQFRTMADTLDAAHLSWKYYAPAIGASDRGLIWSSFDAISNVRYGSDWSTHVSSPPTKILTDAEHGDLANVSWVVPDYAWSDHPSAGSPYGPSWVAAIVNAIGKSSAWSSTAIVVIWDDWGGFYDNVPPPQRDFRGLGIRVGCIIISPYVRPHVSHTVYEFGSILHFVEQTFNLPPLGSEANGYTDRRAKSIRDSFDFSQNPRAFKPIPAPYSATFFKRHAASMRVPDNE